MLTEDNRVHIIKLFFDGPNVRLHLSLDKEELVEKERTALTVVYQDCLKRKISLHLIGDMKTEEKKFINSLANGIVLYGYLEVV